MESHNLLKNVHTGLELPCENVERLSLVKGDYDYWHYGCDGLDDRGWGCGYRTLQTIASWIISRKSLVSMTVPSIHKIQSTLVEIQDKPKSFLGTKQWIGSFEVCIVIDQLFDVPCKIMNVRSGGALSEHSQAIFEHFEKFGSPLMMGGDADASSKGIFGICQSSTGESFLLVVDPHYVRTLCHSEADVKKSLIDDHWISWKCMRTNFVNHSFYNLCLPQLL